MQKEGATFADAVLIALTELEEEDWKQAERDFAKETGSPILVADELNHANANRSAQSSVGSRSGSIGLSAQPLVTVYMYHGSTRANDLKEVLDAVARLKSFLHLKADPHLDFEEIATDSGVEYNPPIRRWWFTGYKDTASAQITKLEEGTEK